MQILAVAICLPLLLIVLMFVRSLTSKPPANLGVTDGRLAPAPESPNCVLTQTDSEEHRMDPIVIPAGQTSERVMEIVEQVVKQRENATVVTTDDQYLHAEFTSTFFRFVDDVEFYVDDEAGLIHFRSASRTGYSDLGVNRNRMTELTESIRSQLEGGRG